MLLCWHYIEKIICVLFVAIGNYDWGSVDSARGRESELVAKSFKALWEDPGHVMTEEEISTGGIV